MILGREPFFKGSDNNDQLIRIARVLGTDDIIEYTKKCGLKLPDYFDDKLVK